MQWCWLNWDSRIAIESRAPNGSRYGTLDPDLFAEMQEGSGLNQLLDFDTAKEARDFISRTTIGERDFFFSNFGTRAPKVHEFPAIGEPLPAETI